MKYKINSIVEICGETRTFLLDKPTLQSFYRYSDGSLSEEYFPVQQAIDSLGTNPRFKVKIEDYATDTGNYFVKLQVKVGNYSGWLEESDLKFIIHRNKPGELIR